MRVSRLLILLILVIGMIAPAVPVTVAQDSDGSGGFCPWRHGSWDYNYMLLNDKKVPIDVMRLYVFGQVSYILDQPGNLTKWGRVYIKFDPNWFKYVYGTYPARYVVKACILSKNNAFTNCTVVLDTTEVGPHIIDLKPYMNETGWSNFYLVATAKNEEGIRLLHDAVHLMFYWDYMTNDWQKYVDVYVDWLPTSVNVYASTGITVTSADTNLYDLLSEALSDLRKIKVTAVDETGLEWPVNYIIIPANDKFYIYISFYYAYYWKKPLHLRVYLLKYPVADWLSYTYIRSGNLQAPDYPSAGDDGWSIIPMGKLSPGSGDGNRADKIGTEAVTPQYRRLYIFALSTDAEQYDIFLGGYYFKWYMNEYPAVKLSSGDYFTMAPSFSASRDAMTHIFFVNYVDDEVSWIYKYYDGPTSLDVYKNFGTLAEYGYSYYNLYVRRYWSNGEWLSTQHVYYARAITLPGLTGVSAVGNIVIPSDDLSYYCSGQASEGEEDNNAGGGSGGGGGEIINVPALLLWLLPLIIILISIAALGLAGGIAVAVLPIMALAIYGLVPLWFVVAITVGLLLAAAFIKRGGGG